MRHYKNLLLRVILCYFQGKQHLNLNFLVKCSFSVLIGLLACLYWILSYSEGHDWYLSPILVAFLYMILYNSLCLNFLLLHYVWKCQKQTKNNNEMQKNDGFLALTIKINFCIKYTTQIFLRQVAKLHIQRFSCCRVENL